MTLTLHRAARLRPDARVRRGAALFLTLLLTSALTALALCAIALSSSSSLVTRFYDRERDFRYAAEAGLGLARARLAKDASLTLPDSGYVVIPNTTLTDAAGKALPRAQVTVYAGRSGNVTDQFGVFGTIVAEAQDQNGTRHVRRLELVAENFARFAMFTDTWQSGLCYGTGEYIRGLAWSNQDWVSCGSPEYADSVGAVGSVRGGSPTFKKGAKSVRGGQSAIPLPTVARLAKLPSHASAGNLNFSPTPGRAMMRLEFVAADVDGDGTASGVGEGFVRVFEAYSLPDPANGNAPSAALGRERARVAGWWNAGATDAMPRAVADSVCGDFHGGLFYPIAVHTRDWFPKKAYGSKSGPGGGAAYADSVATIDDAARERILANPEGARCYPAGDPHLVAVERLSSSTSAVEKGGDDTTFTATGRWGSWRQYSTAPATSVRKARKTDAEYLFPLSKSLNPGFKGVVYVGGDAWVSGTLRGMVTLYGASDIRFVDDLTYVTNPSSPGRSCTDFDHLDMLGVIAAKNVMVDNNALNRPQRVRRPAVAGAVAQPGDFGFLSGTGPHFRLHAVTMALTGTVGVDGYETGPFAVALCNGAATSGGCIAQTGGVIEKYISATFDGVSSGFAENRQSDKCMAIVSPPYFPITGRWFKNRYYEVDPARFDVAALFRGIQSSAQ